MIPKIGAALSKFLEPLKPIRKALSTAKPGNGDGGGHGNLPFEKWKKHGQNPEHSASDGKPNTQDPHPKDLTQPIPLRPGLTTASKAPLEEKEHPASDEVKNTNPEAGLTQVILDIHAAKKELPNGSAVTSYESGSREQKTGTRLPKGSMLDKKIG